MAIAPTDAANTGQPRGSVVFSPPGSPITQAASIFSDGERIDWTARFVGPAAAMQLEIVTVRCHRSGWEEVVSGHKTWLSHPDIAGWTGWIGPGAYEGPGAYLLRVVASGKVLAEGRFDVVSEASSLVH